MRLIQFRVFRPGQAQQFNPPGTPHPGFPNGSRCRCCCRCWLLVVGYIVSVPTRRRRRRSSSTALIRGENGGINLDGKLFTVRDLFASKGSRWRRVTERGEGGDSTDKNALRTPPVVFAVDGRSPVNLWPPLLSLCWVSFGGSALLPLWFLVL